MSIPFSFYNNQKAIPCNISGCSFVTGNNSFSESVKEFELLLTEHHKHSGEYYLMFDRVTVKDEKHFVCPLCMEGTRTFQSWDGFRGHLFSENGDSHDVKTKISQRLKLKKGKKLKMFLL